MLQGLANVKNTYLNYADRVMQQWCLVNLSCTSEACKLEKKNSYLDTASLAAHCISTTTEWSWKYDVRIRAVRNISDTDAVLKEIEQQ